MNKRHFDQKNQLQEIKSKNERKYNIKETKILQHDDPNLLDHLMYSSYEAQREHSPHIHPERWKKIYGPVVDRFEKIYLSRKTKPQGGLQETRKTYKEINEVSVGKLKHHIEIASAAMQGATAGYGSPRTIDHPDNDTHHRSSVNFHYYKGHSSKEPIHSILIHTPKTPELSEQRERKVVVYKNRKTPLTPEEINKQDAFAPSRRWPHRKIRNRRTPLSAEEMNKQNAYELLKFKPKRIITKPNNPTGISGDRTGKRKNAVYTDRMHVPTTEDK